MKRLNITSTLIIIFFISLIFSNNLTGQNKQFKTKLWKFETNGKIFTPPLVHQSVIYFGSSDNSFYAVDSKSGKSLWSFKTGGEVNSGSVIDNGMIYFVSKDGNLYSLNLGGSLAWKFKTEGENKYDAWDYYLSTPVISGDIVYFGSGDNNIYAVNKLTGKKIWSYKTGGIVHTQGEISKGNIYFGSFDGVMYCLDKINGKLKWKFDTVGNLFFPKGEIQSSATVYNDVLYFGSRDYIIYALNAEKGTGVWIEQTPSWVIAKPTIKDSVVYFGNSDGPQCYAFDAIYGQKIWERPILLNVFGAALVTSNEVYYPSFDGKIYVLDKEKGEINYTINSDLAEKNFFNIFTEDTKIKKTILTEANKTGDYGKVYDLLHTLGSVLAMPAIEENLLYFTSTDGSLYAYSY